MNFRILSTLPLLSLLALTGAAPSTPTPEAIIASMKSVADWQLAQPQPAKRPLTDWVDAPFHVGLVALYQTSHDPKYLDAMKSRADTVNWQPGKRPSHADDIAITQAYLDIFLLDPITKTPSHLSPTQSHLDNVIKNVDTSAPLPKGMRFNQNRWTWCDALFMAPPAFARLTALTGDPKYLEFADHEWWATTDLLYDTSDHLFYRDPRFLMHNIATSQPAIRPNTEEVSKTNKTFWGRGNGWVYAGLARTLQYLPKDHPSRPKYENLFKEMTQAVLKARHEDGLWRSNLLHPKPDAPGETSATALLLFGLTYGANSGLLNKQEVTPLILQSWTTLTARVLPTGQLTYTQGVGDRPGTVPPDHTEPYATGAYLLASAQLHTLLTSAPTTQP